MKNVKEYISEAIVKGKLKQYTNESKLCIYWSIDYKFYGVFIDNVKTLKELTGDYFFNRIHTNEIINNNMLLEPIFGSYSKTEKYEYLTVNNHTWNKIDGEKFIFITTISKTDFSYKYWDKQYDKWENIKNTKMKH